PQREFAGPVTGLQDIYRSGLAHLDDRSQQAYGVDFKDAPGPAQDLLLSDQTDGDLQTFVGAALANTLEAMYGPPEYGGNRDLVGWGYTRWPGDLQPRGSTDAEVSTAGPDTGAITGALLDDLQRFLPGLTGQRASRTQFWLGRAGTAHGAHAVGGRAGHGTLVRGRREHAAHGGWRRHRALGCQDAPLLAPGLQGPVALRAGPGRQRRRLAPHLRRPGAVLRRDRAATR